MRKALALSLVPFLIQGPAACDDGEETGDSEADADSDTDTDTDDTGPIDADGDGWTVAGGDCDDANPAVHPEADEVVADGEDQDCDGTEVCYEDGDGDEYGTSLLVESENLLCSNPGVSDDNTDCDDDDAEVHPGAKEICGDGVDQDCSGTDLGCEPGDDCLVARWRFDGDATDDSGYGNDGTVHGAILTAGHDGSEDSAYHFDGEDDYIQVPTSTSLDSIEEGGAITISAWTYSDSGTFPVVEKYVLRSDGCWEYVLQTVNTLFVTPGDNMAVGSPSGTAGTWLFVAVTYEVSAGEVRFYADGEVIDTVSFSASLSDTENGPVHIGWSKCGGDEYSDGVIDDLRLYNCALTDDEIADLYSAE